ncbi:MAG: ABC transporter permease [[Eubacterium] siraeum]
MKGKAIKNIITTVGLPVLFGALIFTLWQTKVLHTLFKTDEIILPLPTRIGSIIGDNFTNMLPQIASTLIVALGGLVLGSILGYFIGVAGAVFKKWGMGGLTIVSAFNAIPLVALAPVINNWTRDLSSVVDIRSTVAKIITVTIFCTASMSVNAYRGLTEVKPFSEDLFASYGSSKLKMFFKLRLPNSLALCIHGFKSKRSVLYNRCGSKRILRRAGNRCRQTDKREHSKGSVPDSVGIYNDSLRNGHTDVHHTPHS